MSKAKSIAMNYREHFFTFVRNLVISIVVAAGTGSVGQASWASIDFKR